MHYSFVIPANEPPRDKPQGIKPGFRIKTTKKIIDEGYIFVRERK